MTQRFCYFGQRFQQRPGSPSAVLFLAPAEEISAWGGVPQKSSRFMKGFQRAEMADHWREIAEFFEESGNISPTAVVVAFKPNQVKVEQFETDSLLTEDCSTGEPVRVIIELEDYANESVDVLANLVYKEFASRVLGSIKSLPNDEDGSELDPSEELEDESGDVEPGSELALPESHLGQFLAFLQDKETLRHAREENEAALRSILLNLLKPGTIVDGQHRTRGAAFLEQKIPFPIVALLDADWREQVFQFVVINQKAKEIPAEFLSAIISSSLSPQEIEQLKARLEQARVPLDSTRIMDLVHTHHSSPFRGMVNFRIQGETGQLGYAGMLTLAKRFREIKTHTETKFKPFFLTVFASVCPGASYSEQREAWREGVWFQYFAAFWNRVRSNVGTSPGYGELWEPGTNLMKIVTLQELQNLFLEWLYNRMEPIADMADFEAKVDLYLKHLKPKFFEKDWLLTSLQSATGRGYLREALSKAVKDPSYRYGDPLFRGISEGT